MDPLLAIFVCLVVLYVTTEVLKLIGIPRVVSQIVVGMLLGLPVFREMLFAGETFTIVKFLGTLGAILLLFFVGLQMDVRMLRKDVRHSLWVSFFNTTIPLCIGFAVSHYLFGLPWGVSAIVGVCLSVTATAFALDVLEECGKLKTALGKFIIYAGSIDDMIELILVTAVIGFIGSLEVSLPMLLVNILVFIGALVVLKMFLLPKLLSIIDHHVYRPALFSGAILVMLLLAVLADYLQVSAVMGALFAGIIVRSVMAPSEGHKPWERAEIAHTVHSIAFGFFVPFFFLWVGLNTNMVSIIDDLPFALTITGIAIAGTVFGTAIGNRVATGSWKHSWLLGWAMNGKGDTGLVISQLALTAGVISTQIYSSLIFMAVVSTVISPMIFEYMLKRT